MRRQDVDMLSGSIVKGLLAISIPIMIMNVVQSLFSIIDMTILKTFSTSGDTSIGAVGVCGTLITLITGLVIGIASGSDVIIARHIGRRDQGSVSRSIHSSMAFAVAAGIVLALIGILGAKTFLRWANCPDELLEQAAVYFRLYFAGVPILVIYNFCAAMLRSAGDTRRPMLYLSIGGAVKVCLTLLLTAEFQLGVKGVAFSTLCSWSIAAALSLWTLSTNHRIVHLNLRKIRFYKEELSQILHIGIPAGLQEGLYAIANVVISATVNSFGPAATTGISIANTFDAILYYICTAPALAVMPYVSQNIGSGNVKRAMQSVWKSIGITIALGASFGALSAIFSGQLSSMMTSDPGVIQYSQQKMIIISSTYFICGINSILGSALRGMGKPVAATIATLLFMCAIRFVWVYCIFPLLPNLTFLYLIWPIGWVLSIAMLLCVFFPTAKKLKQNAMMQA